jgi:hypothetical protein
MVGDSDLMAVRSPEPLSRAVAPVVALENKRESTLLGNHHNLLILLVGGDGLEPPTLSV